MTEGEAQGIGLPKKQRRREEWSVAPWEEKSLKGVSYGGHYKDEVSKRLPTKTQTNPCKCHKSSQMNTLYPYTSHMLGAGP